VTVESVFTVTPESGTILTDFLLDAGASTTTSDSLEFRWDLEGDGSWDTGWLTSTTLTHRYYDQPGEGIDTIEVRLEVRSGAAGDTSEAEIVLDLRHGLLLKTLSIPVSHPSALGSDHTHLWLADWGAPGTGRLYKISPASGDTLYSLPSPDIWPCGVAWDGSNLCVTGYLALRRVDAQTGEVSSDFTVVYSEHPGGLAWDGECFYHGSAGEGDGADGLIHKYSAEGTHLVSFEAPHGNRDMEGLAFDGQELWVTVRHEDTLYVVDRQDGDILKRLYVSGQSGDLAFLDGYVWVQKGMELGQVVP
jgi:hypothetical protein